MKYERVKEWIRRERLLTSSGRRAEALAQLHSAAVGALNVFTRFSSTQLHKRLQLILCAAEGRLSAGRLVSFSHHVNVLLLPPNTALVYCLNVAHTTT